MNKLTINGIELEFGSDVDVQIEGSKVTVRAKAAALAETYHHYYHSSPFWQIPMVQPSFPVQPWIGPNITCGPLSSGTYTITGNDQSTSAQ